MATYFFILYIFIFPCLLILDFIFSSYCGHIFLYPLYFHFSMSSNIGFHIFLILWPHISLSFIFSCFHVFEYWLSYFPHVVATYFFILYIFIFPCLLILDFIFSSYCGHIFLYPLYFHISKSSNIGFHIFLILGPHISLSFIFSYFHVRVSIFIVHTMAYIQLTTSDAARW